MGHLRQKGNNIYEEFSSLHEMEHTICTRPVNDSFRGQDHSSESGSYGFTHTNSMDEARKLMLDGWDEPLSRIAQDIKQSEKDFIEFHAKRVMPRNGVVGVVPNVPRAMMGLPDSMIQYVRERESAKTIRIMYNITASGSTEKEELIKSGSAILSVVNLIEKMGVRVRLDMMEVSSNSGMAAGWGLVLKDYRAPLDLKKICFPIAHPSMLRRIAFKWMETTPGILRGFVGGYGYPEYSITDNKNYMELALGMDNENFKYMSVRDVSRLQYDVKKLYLHLTGKTGKDGEDIAA